MGDEDGDKKQSDVLEWSFEILVAGHAIEIGFLGEDAEAVVRNSKYECCLHSRVVS